MLILGNVDRKFANNKISRNNVDDENDDNCQNNHRKKNRQKEKVDIFLAGYFSFLPDLQHTLKCSLQEWVMCFSLLSVTRFFSPFFFQSWNRFFFCFFSVGMEKYRTPQRYHAASIFIEKRREWAMRPLRQLLGFHQL